MKRPEPFGDDRKFETWFIQRIGEDENPAGVHKLRGILREAFDAGVKTQADANGPRHAHAARLRSWADNLTAHGPNVTHWGSLTFVISELRRMADDMVGGAEQPTGQQASATPIHDSCHAVFTRHGIASRADLPHRLIDDLVSWAATECRKAREHITTKGDVPPAERTDRISESSIMRAAGNIMGGLVTDTDGPINPDLVSLAVRTARDIASEVQRTKP